MVAVEHGLVIFRNVDQYIYSVIICRSVYHQLLIKGFPNRVMGSYLCWWYILSFCWRGKPKIQQINLSLWIIVLLRFYVTFSLLHSRILFELGLGFTWLTFLVFRICNSQSYINKDRWNICKTIEILLVQDIRNVDDGKTTNLHEIVGDSFPADSGICFRGAGEKGDYVEIKFIVTRS